MFKQYLRKHRRVSSLLKATRRFLFRYLYTINHRRIIMNYLESHHTRRLQIGSGRNALLGWLNTDLDPTKEIVFLDATKKLPFDNMTFDYVYFEHLIEHLKYQDGVKLVQECYRVLKPGGRLRVSTPDLRFLVELYSENKTELQERYIVWAIDTRTDYGIHLDTFVINNFFRSWGHRFIYDYKTLKGLLEKCGFCNIIQCNPGESNDKNLKCVESHGREIGDEFNKLESIVLEATKPVCVSRNASNLQSLCVECQHTASGLR